ncbi:MAG: TldD/PmbA family protein [Candidatus Thermoplasmatota archaeon]|nr:TldD/PmbA family protein [Candidatus Thermoplasmatota archaeon]
MMICYAVEMAKKAGMDDAVAKLVSRKEKQIKFHKSEISTIKEWEEITLEMFMAKGKKNFMLVFENPDRKRVGKAIRDGEGIIKLLSPKERYHGLGENEKKYVDKKKYDENIDDERKILSLANKTIDDALKHAEEVAGIIYAGKETINICSSRGINENDKNSWITLSTRAFSSDKASGHAVQCSRTLKSIKKNAGKEAGKIAEMALHPKKIERGKYDIIFSHLSFANLISYMAVLSSAFYVDSGMSFLAGKMKKNIGSENITLIDSGIHPDGIASRKFDDEGLATGETVIVDKGQLKSYLHNTSTAYSHKTKTTGNAGIIYPSPWNEVVMPGDVSLEEMLEGVERGIYVTNVWYTRFQNYMTGDFSTIARDGAFFVEDGAISYPVEGIRISDNMLRILKNVKLLSNDSRQICWWEVEVPTFTPQVLIKNVNITRSFM